MRPLITALPLLLLVPACANDATDTASDDPPAEAYTAALSASEAEGDGQALGALAFPRMGMLPGRPMNPAQRIANIKEFIKDHLTCAEAVAQGDQDLTLTFTKDCTWSGRRWNGEVTITYSADGGSADIDFQGVNVNGATLTGAMTVTQLEEGHVTVEADWTRVGPRHTVEGSWDGDYAWTETTWIVNSATHVVTVDGQSATRTTTAVVWQREDRAPESGSVTFTGFRGKTWTMVFGRDDSGQLIVTVTGPEGNSRVFTPGAPPQA